MAIPESDFEVAALLEPRQIRREGDIRQRMLQLLDERRKRSQRIAGPEHFRHGERFEPLVGLDKKVQPAHTALLVIDMQIDFIASVGLVGRSGRDVSVAQKLAERLPDFIAAARRAGVLVVFVRNVYSTDRNFYLSDSWLEQAARKQSGGYTRFPVCAEGAPRRILSTKSPARR